MTPCARALSFTKNARHHVMSEIFWRQDTMPEGWIWCEKHDDLHYHHDSFLGVPWLIPLCAVTQNALRNAAIRLKPGGLFVGTTTDANVLLKKLQAAPGAWQCVVMCCCLLECWSVDMCHSVVRCVAVCCSVLQCVAVWYSVVQMPMYCSVLRCSKHYRLY